MKKDSSKGFTFIEIIIVVVILSTISAISIYFLVNSLKTYTMAVNQKVLFDEGKLALERICREVRDAKNITSPAAGGSGNSITFTKTNATAQDLANESITFQLNPTNPTILEKIKSSPPANPGMAFHVTRFWVTRGAAPSNENEITLELTLQLTSGENVTLQTKVYPKNLNKDATLTYKNFFQNWMEEVSS
jgi:prepilin-type N-terminal cleavage/methylation domain-containing protein